MANRTGEKKFLKNLNRMANELPAATYNATVRCSGQAMIDRGISTFDGEPVDVKKVYPAYIEKRPVNHRLRLKRAYKSNGLIGVQAYLAKHGYTLKAAA